MKTSRPDIALSDQVLASTDTQLKADTLSEVIFTTTQREVSVDSETPSKVTDVFLAIPSPSTAGFSKTPQLWTELRELLAPAFSSAVNPHDLENVYSQIQSLVEQRTKDGALMVHSLLARIDHSTGQLSFFNCGIHSLMLYHNELSEMTGIGSSGIPLSGRMPHQHNKHSLPISEGDTLYAVWGDTCFTLELSENQEVTLLRSSTTHIPPQMKARYTLSGDNSTGAAGFSKPQ